MEIVLKLQCPECQKSFIVYDSDVEDDELVCPHWKEDVDVPEDD